MLSSMMGMSPPSHLDKSTTVPGSLLVSLELSQGWNLYLWPSSFLDSTPESGPFSRELGVSHKGPFSKRVGKSKRCSAGKAALKACYQCWYVTEPELQGKMQKVRPVPGIQWHHLLPPLPLRCRGAVLEAHLVSICNCSAHSSGPQSRILSESWWTRRFEEKSFEKS